MKDYNFKCIEEKDTITPLVISLCADYKRREKILKENKASAMTIIDCRHYNRKIFEAVAEVVGVEDAETYIEALGSRKGYSCFFGEDYISEKTYYAKKQDCIANICKYLHLG